MAGLSFDRNLRLPAGSPGRSGWGLRARDALDERVEHFPHENRLADEGYSFALADNLRVLREHQMRLEL